MSFFEALMNFISSLFGGNKPAQPAEQKKQTLPPGVEEVVPHSDPRVAATNNNRGLVTGWIEEEPYHYVIKYESGRETSAAGKAALETRIQNGITTVAIEYDMLRCVDDVRCNRDLSRWTAQQVFDAKVYLGRIVIEK